MGVEADAVGFKSFDDDASYSEVARDGALSLRYDSVDGIVFYAHQGQVVTYGIVVPCRKYSLQVGEVVGYIGGAFPLPWESFSVGTGS